MPAMSTPSIRISQHQRFASPPRYPSSAHAPAAPMAIRGAQEPVPPPLPPPSYIPQIGAGHDPGWQWGNDPNKSDFGKLASVKPGSSLLGGGAGPTKSARQEKEHEHPLYYNADHVRRGSSVSTLTITRDHDMGEGSLTSSDEDGGLSRPPSNNYRLQGEKQLEQKTLEASSNTYDKQLLSRIGGPNGGPPTPKRTSISYGMQETAQLAHAEAERRNSQLRPLSMPERRQQSSLDSPSSSRWPSSGAISPGFNAKFWPEHGPSDHSTTTINTAPTRHGSLTFDDSVSQRGSYDQSMFMSEDLNEDGPMSNLNIHDRSPGSSEEFQPAARAGTKRRASSPPREGLREERSSVSSAPGHSDLYHRRSIQQLPNRGSPVSRFHPNHSSLSSASSFGPRQNSLSSSLGIASIPSSATSYGSGRLSPSALSPALEPNNAEALNANSLPINPAHQRTLSESVQGGLQKPPVEGAARNGSISHLQGIYVCECCPKKPKKFDTEEELRLHESEKQYTCAYCPNRFKNKNEAERHQNSLHLRRHSWSCAALASVQAAFHASLTGNGTDICGYCGEEFPNPPQWDVRAEHLNHVHKFGECNHAKKFFRADHFRQHLKHSHAGTSGKWTNMLEIACMKDEPLPEKRVSPSAAQQDLQAGAPSGIPPEHGRRPQWPTLNEGAQ
ncbi:hypothetical protein DOTSEDRAFT_75929 [Lecanosticta acicola]|uniref:C2H2-type domain-containing protein n=1 Tax=Lecanosticta acicola TaxID=111012 RepID=A0AAI8Z6I2_9PEZI|nr:hypothetical protein DOTSEDRAFT_75929 [Lecanosticta acicola]